MARLPRLVEPCVLLLLSDGRPRHGYEILEALREDPFAGAEIDTGIVYRTLHALEVNGMATSGWEPSTRGPKRRVYQITEPGRQHMADWSIVLGRLSRRIEELSEHIRAV